MTFKKAMDAAKRKNVNQLIKYAHHDTINQLIIDLYISFQDNTEDAIKERKEIKNHIIDITESFWSAKHMDGKNWELENTFNSWVDTEVLEVLKYILVPEHKPLGYIPEIFTARFKRLGLTLSVSDFYCYRD